MKKISTKVKRKLRNRKKLKSTRTDRYRISITKSLKNLSAQIIDDKQNKTLVSASSIEKEIKNKIVVIALINIIFAYSPRKNKAKLMELYSTK